MMNRIQRAALVLLGLVVGLAVLPSPTTSAAPLPPPFIWSQVIVEGVESEAVLSVVTDRLFPLDGSGAISGPDAFLTGVADPEPGPTPPADFCQDPPVTDNGDEHVRDRRCELTTGAGEYFHVIGSVPAGYSVDYDCDISFSLETIDGMDGIVVELLENERPSCFHRITRPVHLSTYVEVSGEDADGGPFDAATLLGPITAEAFAVSGGAQVLPGDCPSKIDSADTFPAAKYIECALPAPGEYQAGLADVPNGMVLDSVECYDPSESGERFEDPEALFTFVDTVIYCDAFYRFVRKTVTVDLVVTNDDDGTAVGADFEIEVYDTSGDLVASGFDPAPNDESASAEFTLGIGDYQLGISGPDGYDSTVTVESEIVTTELIDDASAEFTLTELATVSAVIGMDDQTAPTTTAPATTAAPTTAAPTTAAPTTAAPTTVAPTDPTTTMRPTTELPATGAPSSSGVMMWAAIGLLLLGAGIALSARRPTTR